MHPSADDLHQHTLDRIRERRADAAAYRLAGPTSVRVHLARTLRRAADRLDGPAVVSARADSAGAESAGAVLSAAA